MDGALRQVARALAAWHAAAPRDPQIAAQGGQDALRARWRANVGQARACGDLLEGAGLEEIDWLAGRFIAGRAPLFQERIRAGRVVDGHGDLLADDIFCLEDGVRILDCLEFDDRLRWLDGLDDASFLAMDLERLGAHRLGFTVLSGDRIRKELAGVSAEQRCAALWGTGIYTAAWTERVYAELLGRAGRLLGLGESVIADASFITPGQRAAAAQAAAAAHADLVQLRCTAPAEVAGQRLAGRTGGISDADTGIARQMAAVEAAWLEAVTIDTGQLSPGTAPVIPAEPPGTVAQQAIEAIRPHRPEHVRRPVRPVLLPD